MEPPVYIDGAKVLKWAWSGLQPFGVVSNEDGSEKEEIYGLAICKYESSTDVYRFSCDKNQGCRIAYLVVDLPIMLVFLDIDGVIVPAKGHKAPDLLKDGFAAFSTNASHVLNSLIAEFDATIMLTTSHKSNYSLLEWETIFKARGVQARKIKSLPINVNHLSRKEEIVNWFNQNKLNEDFVIIDDDKSLNDLPEYLKPRLILTSSYVGLTENHLEEIRNIFEDAPASNYLFFWEQLERLTEAASVIHEHNQPKENMPETHAEAVINQS